MADITLAQVDARLAAAWSALDRNHTSYSVGGRSFSFGSRSELMAEIDWLRGLRRELADAATVAAGGGGAAQVRFVEGYGE